MSLTAYGSAGAVDDGTFVCAMCGGTFPREWSEEVAQAERVALFGPHRDEDGPDAIVCDTCFQAMTTLVPPPGLSLLGRTN